MAGATRRRGRGQWTLSPVCPPCFFFSSAAFLRFLCGQSTWRASVLADPPGLVSAAGVESLRAGGPAGTSVGGRRGEPQGWLTRWD